MVLRVFLLDLLRFETCCKNALAATLSLVSKVSDMKSSILEAMYRKRCEQEIEDPEDGDPLEELEEEEDVKPHAKSKTECEEFLEHLQQDAECNRMWASEDPDAFAAQDQEDPLGVDAETKDLPDGELLKHLCTLANVAEAFGMETAVSPKSGERREGNHLPSSLLEAVQMKGDLFNSLFRLLVRLRSAKGGMDTMWIRNSRNSRRASRSLNWHQQLGWSWGREPLAQALLFHRGYIIGAIS